MSTEKLRQDAFARTDCDSVNVQLINFLKTEIDRKGFIFYDIKDQCRILNVKEVVGLACQFANLLKQSGFQQGDIICNALPNSPERVVTDFGIFILGGIMLNGQMVLSSGEDLIQNLNAANCKGFIYHRNPKNSFFKLFSSFESDKTCPENLVQHISMKEIPSLKFTIGIQRSKLEGVTGFKLDEDVKAFSTDYEVTKLPCKDTVCIFTTSGSTGYSKLVPRTHLQMTYWFEIASEMKDQVYFNRRPLGWMGGFPFYFFAGATHVLFDELETDGNNFSPTYIWDVICKEKPISLSLSTVDLDKIAASNLDYSKFQAEYMILGGMPISKKIFKTACSIAKNVVMVYGSTEMGGISDKLINKGNVDSYCLGDCGKINTTRYTVRVVDSDEKDVEPGTVGEFLVKSPMMFTHYVGNDQATKEAFTEDGFFRSSDIGYITKDGHFFALGRSKDAIMMGAYIVYPAFVEEVLLRCSGVKDALVVPIPDEVSFHKICACIVKAYPNLTEDSLKQMVNDQFADSSSSLTPVPDFYEFFESFPFTATSKVDRKAVQEMALKRLQNKQ